MLLHTLVARIIREREKNHSLVQHETLMDHFAGNRVNGIKESILAVDVVLLN